MTDPVLTAAQGWLAAGHGCAIATVFETWGSAPRRRGAHLVVRDDGLFEGSVSGGCVEGDVIATALGLIAAGGFSRRDYGVSDATAWEVGLACGGRISVLIQSIDPNHFPPALIDRILAAQAAGEIVTIATDPATGQSTETGAEAEGLFVNRYMPPLRLAVIGAVHIAQALVPMARMLGYRPIVIDPRTMFATAARFPDDVEIDTRWPDEALADWRPNAASALVTLTHDPKLDDPALEAALCSPAFYIAALGSRRTHAARIERLRAAGHDDSALARIHGPAGLAIGAANPAEIAVSVLAEMTAVLRGRR